MFYKLIATSFLFFSMSIFAAESTNSSPVSIFFEVIEGKTYINGITEEEWEQTYTPMGLDELEQLLQSGVGFQQISHEFSTYVDGRRLLGDKSEIKKIFRKYTRANNRPRTVINAAGTYVGSGANVSIKANHGNINMGGAQALDAEPAKAGRDRYRPLPALARFIFLL